MITEPAEIIPILVVAADHNSDKLIFLDIKMISDSSSNFTTDGSHKKPNNIILFAKFKY
jgi:hypothetical protein